MTALLLAVTAHSVVLGLCLAMAAAFVLLCGVIWLLRPVPVQTIPEAPASTRRALAAAPARAALPAAGSKPARRRQAADPCPDCGGGVVVSGHTGEAVASCTSCSWSLTQRRNVA